jgi:hypothetical protein
MRKYLARVASVRWLAHQTRSRLLLHRLTWRLLYPTQHARQQLETRWMSALADFKKGHITLDTFVDQVVNDLV